MEAERHAAPTGTGRETVRRYFAQLMLAHTPRPTLTQWGQLPVEQFFVALTTPQRAINIAGRPCGDEVVPLASLFADIKWG